MTTLHRSITGRGLFSGVDVSCRVMGSSRDGLWFKGHDGVAIPAGVERLVVEPRDLPPGLRVRCTILGDARAQFMTVEHALSACVGLGVWNAVFEIDGPELPVDDGSASVFVDSIRALGERLDATPQERIIRSTIRVQDPRDADAWIEARPHDMPGCRYRYELAYGQAFRAVIPDQTATIHLHGRETADEYAREVAPARTFCLAQEAEAMRAMGLLAGFSPRDLLVIGRDGPIDNRWRFDNEPARHKLLDLIGDLALVGGPIRGEIVAHRSGHALNHALARAIVAHYAEATTPVGSTIPS